MNIFTTSDLALAAYMVMKSLNLVSARRLESGRFEFRMEDPEVRAEKLALEFVSSEFAQYDNQIRALKKLLYSN
jgi:hypothetical protein